MHNVIDRLVRHPHRHIETGNQVLYHVGDLSGKREIPWFSAEGKEASVSPCPNVWKKITDLQGDTYELQNTNAVMYHINPETKVTMGELHVCCRNNFITLEEGAVVERFDPEYNETRYWKHYSVEDAKEQAHTIGVDPEKNVTKQFMPRVDSNGKQYCEDAFEKPVSELSPLDVETLIPIWSVGSIGEVGTVDGVFWEYETNPSQYTAAKGLIFQNELNRWVIDKTK